MISPPSRSATRIESSVFPVAVGPVSTSASLAMPAETALQLLERETDDGRPAVHVVRRELGLEETIEELSHLGLRETLPRLDGRLAGERHRDPLVLVPGGPGQFAPGRELRDHLPQAPFGIEVRVRDRRGVDDDGPAAERLDLEPRRLEERAHVLDDPVLRGREPEREREEEALAHHPSIREPAHHLLEEDALVGGVLIDDEEPAPGLGEDVGVVDLPEGRPASGPTPPRPSPPAPGATARPSTAGTSIGTKNASWSASSARRAGAARPPGVPARPPVAAPDGIGRWSCGSDGRASRVAALSRERSAARTASSTIARISARSRNLTSAFAGWTLTSTPPGGTSR